MSVRKSVYLLIVCFVCLVVCFALFIICSVIVWQIAGGLLQLGLFICLFCSVDYLFCDFVADSRRVVAVGIVYLLIVCFASLVVCFALFVICLVIV